jgi:hypothetical protein
LTPIRYAAQRLLHVRDFSIMVAVVGAAAVLVVVVKILRRWRLKRLVRARLYSGLCIMCGADLRFGKEQCPKCGCSYGRAMAMAWENILESRRHNPPLERTRRQQ